MTKEEFSEYAKQFISLVHCGIDGSRPAPALPENANLSALLSLAKRHYLSAAASRGLKAAGQPLSAPWEQAQGKALRLDVLQETYFAEFSDAFSAAGIPFLPLKGARLKALYPEPYLREMSDFDVLYREEDFNRVKEILLSLGWTFNEKTLLSNHQVFHKEPLGHLEMHRALFSSNSPFSSFFADPWAKAVRDETRGGTCYRLSPENEYLHIVLHAYKHFEGAGNGLRMLTDFYLIEQKLFPSLDRAYVEKELAYADSLVEKDALPVSVFEKTVLRETQAIFSDEPTLDDTALLIISMGVYGKIENVWKKEIEKQGKVKYFFSRLFPPYKIMKEQSKILQKCPVLLPFYWIKRLFRGVFFRRKAVKSELKYLKNVQK